MQSAHLAIDLGASSGRAFLGIVDSSTGRVTLDELHRFDHRPCSTPSGPVWNLTGIWRDIQQGIRLAASTCRSRDIRFASVGVDAWGVDYVLIGRNGELLGLPHCYRDPRNLRACQEAMALLGGAEALYLRTGIQLMPFNTLFQLYAARRAEPKTFAAASRLLFLPDLFHYWLCGEKANERTIASTSAMLDVATGEWDRQLVEQMGVNPDLLGSLVEPGTTLGVLRAEVAEETQAPAGVRVIAPASHDTASAVVAVPARTEAKDWAYLSSGTWSLLGTELHRTCVTEDAARAPFTHERGVGGTIRFLKNIGGLWLLQELQRELKEVGEPWSFHELVAAARQASSLRTLIDPNDPRLAAPGPMRPRLRLLAEENGEPLPNETGEYVRLCLESLALSYAQTLQTLSMVTGRQFDVLHIVGGGCQNEFLNELTTQAVGCRVTVGPIEASAAGNSLVQAMGCGELADMQEIRDVVARSFSLRSAAPLIPCEAWESARSRFEAISAYHQVANAPDATT